MSDEKCVGVNLVVSAAHLADLGQHSGILTVVFLGSCIIHPCPPVRPLPSSSIGCVEKRLTVGA